MIPVFHLASFLRFMAAYLSLTQLDTLGDLVIYAKNKKEFLVKEIGIEKFHPKRHLQGY